METLCLEVWRIAFRECGDVAFRSVEKVGAGGEKLVLMGRS